MLEILRSFVREGKLIASDPYKMCLIGPSPIQSLEELDQMNKVTTISDNTFSSSGIEESKSPGINSMTSSSMGTSSQ